MRLKTTEGSRSARLTTGTVSLAAIEGDACTERVGNPEQPPKSSGPPTLVARASTAAGEVCGYTPADCASIKVAPLIWQKGRSHNEQGTGSVGKRKGAVILTMTASGKKWEVSGASLRRMGALHMKGSEANPDRLYDFQTSGWSGQVMKTIR